MRKNWRINLILVFIFLFGTAIISRLVFIQIFQQDFYEALAHGQQKIFQQGFGERGKIFLKSNNNEEIPIALDRAWQFCYSSPLEIKNKEETAELLSEVLNLTKEEILEKFEEGTDLFAVIKNKLSEEEVEQLEKLDLTGIYLNEENIRYYPKGDLASQVIGFVGGEGKGQYGIEEHWDKTLIATEGILEGERGPGGYSLWFTNKENFPTNGADLYLTIDYNIQYQAEKLLKKAHQDLKIEGGQVIVMDPNSGKILALADFPGFNLNQYADYAEEGNLEVFQNSSIQKLFEPGSAFKPITMAAALNEGKITPETTYEDKGYLKIGKYTITNYNEMVFGERTMTEVLEKSINTGAVFAQSQLNHQTFLDYIEKFGFFEFSQIDLAGEISSSNEELKKGYEVNFATASFGQGIEITPIQLAQAFAVIANGGKLMKPYLVEKIVKDDEIIEIKPEIKKRQVISPRTAKSLTTMLVSVTENGFAKGAKVPGYYIAGKTGTAQMAFSALDINKEGYSEETWQSFVGFAPAFNPQFLILIKLDNPATRTAEYSAVPGFHDLAKYIINYLQIMPDHE